MDTDSPTPAQAAPEARTFDPSRALASLRANLRRLQHNFARRRSAIQTRSGVELLDGKSVQSRWIVSRSLCMYRTEDFANIPRNRRDAAVALKIPVWSPFERVGHYCAWSGTTAMVWFWNADVVEADAELLGLRPHDTAPPRTPRTDVRMLPEAVLYPKRPDGVHLQACREGFDLQYWRRGAMVDSLWLAEQPDAGRVDAFAAQHVVDGETADGDMAPILTVPAATPATFAADPWAAPPNPRAWLIANERTLVVAALAFFAAVAAFQEARYWRYHLAHDTDSAALRAIDTQLTPVLDARDKLVALSGRNAFLARALNHPSQALLMLHVDRALPSRGLPVPLLALPAGRGLDAPFEHRPPGSRGHHRQPAGGAVVRRCPTGAFRPGRPGGPPAGCRRGALSRGARGACPSQERAPVSAIATSIDRVRAELAASPRLRAGVWAIVAILLGYWVFVPHAARVDEAAAEYASVDGRLVRARDLLAREDWQQRLDAASATEARLVERFWHAANEGLAQAEVRTALEDLARQVKLSPRIDVGLSQPVPGVSDLYQVQVQISGTASLEGALLLVDAIARHPRLLVEERLTFSRVRTSRREEVRMDGLLSAYFRLGAPQTDTAQHPDSSSAPGTRPVGEGLVPFRPAFPLRHGPRSPLPPRPPRQARAP